MSHIADDHGFPRRTGESIKERRMRMARLPVEEKLRILVRMQHIAAEAARSTGRPVKKPWRLD